MMRDPARGVLHLEAREHARLPTLLDEQVGKVLLVRLEQIDPLMDELLALLERGLGPGRECLSRGDHGVVEVLLRGDRDVPELLGQSSASRFRRHHPHESCWLTSSRVAGSMPWCTVLEALSLPSMTLWKSANERRSAVVLEGDMVRCWVSCCNLVVIDGHSFIWQVAAFQGHGG